MRRSDVQGRYARANVLSRTRVKAGMYASLRRQSGTWGGWIASQERTFLAS
jgi:hypothetical protein